MNPHVSYERVEQQRWDNHQAEVEKADWISSRTNELILAFPKTLGEFSNPFANLLQFSSGMRSEKAAEAYENLVWEICEFEATREWEERHFLGEWE